MSKGKTAGEIADLIAERKLVAEKRSYDTFRAKCIDAISKMAIDLEHETVIDLTDQDLISLSKVTEEMRELEYKFRFIEVQDTSGERVGFKLAISVKHML